MTSACGWDPSPDSLVDLTNTLIDSSNPTNTTEFDNPQSVTHVCEDNITSGAGHTWLLPSTQQGYLRVVFKFAVQATAIRLFNTHHDGWGTKTWHISAIVSGISGSFTNFTYTDPETKQLMSCTDKCPLRSNQNVLFQEFEIVTQQSLNGFIDGIDLAITDWYGGGAGLDGIQLAAKNVPGLSSSSTSLAAATASSSLASTTSQANASSTATTTQVTPSYSSTSSPHPDISLDSGLSAGAKAGIVAGCLIGVLALGYLIFYLLRRRRLARQKPSPMQVDHRNLYGLFSKIEMDGSSARHELHAEDRRTELPGLSARGVVELDGREVLAELGTGSS